MSKPSHENFRFRAAPYYHRSAARGAFLWPWEDLRQIWVRFVRGLALIMSATSRLLGGYRSLILTSFKVSKVRKELSVTKE